LPYDQLTSEEMCVLDFNKKRIEGKRKPSVESGLHLKVYQSRPDVNAVIHSHQNYASVFAVLNKPIPSLFDEVTLHIGPIVDVIPYALSGSPELIANIGGKLDNGCHCYLLQNHGALTLGSNLEEAWLNVELLEKTAKIYLNALSSGGKPTLLPDDTVNLLKELRSRPKTKKA
jgi:ribulose-5-phosphate 4-epimerase/fuculose-1-phosphate aldolase